MGVTSYGFSSLAACILSTSSPSHPRENPNLTGIHMPEMPPTLKVSSIEEILARDHSSQIQEQSNELLP
ncbi:hypothetical protein Bca4012_077542 [Brassica carinata]|uniref:Uncharacterized protein n=1 Tax=Brassica cretica TaxID=69181 RepID=A0ABQ7E8U9_BRACR|nr:hypothetical protein DY000_02023998 [Brassica cretica]